MKIHSKLYIGGEWVDPLNPSIFEVVNPLTETVCATVAGGGEDDVARAVAAAREAFKEFSQSSVEDRRAMLERIAAGIKARADEFSEAISMEMGAPTWWSSRAQVPAGIAHYSTAAKVLESFEFQKIQGTTAIRREPIGVCGLITPWNWPLNQVACKVAPALATGCTIVLKPAEQTSLDSLLLAEVIHEAGVPPGVFNLVNGPGRVVGASIAEHPDVDMVSFTGSTMAGANVSKAAADTIKRVSLELGGKSANIVLPSADLKDAVGRAVQGIMGNVGQTCTAGTRLLVPSDKVAEATRIAVEVAESIPLATSWDAPAPAIGPIATKRQHAEIVRLISEGVKEGAKLETGGADRPDGVRSGYFIAPTIFSNVSNDMTIAREEIFGPVLSIIAYDTVDNAIEIANDSPYGLSGYVQGEHQEAVEVARKMRTGQVFVNAAHADFNAPFGGYKQSGNGREWGEIGFDEFLEYKSVLGSEIKN